MIPCATTREKLDQLVDMSQPELIAMCSKCTYSTQCSLGQTIQTEIHAYKNDSEKTKKEDRLYRQPTRPKPKSLKEEAARSMTFHDFHERVSGDARETKDEEPESKTAEQILTEKIRKKREQLKQGGTY